MDQEEFKIHDLVEVPKWTGPVGKNWVIVGFASEGAEACLRRCTDSDMQTFVPLSDLKHQKEDTKDIHLPALQTPEDQDQEAQRQDSAPEEREQEKTIEWYMAQAKETEDLKRIMFHLWKDDDDDECDEYFPSKVERKYRAVRQDVLTWMLDRLEKGLADANFDDNVGCIQRLQRDIRIELGLSGAVCTKEMRDGYREICRQVCDEKQRNICRSKNV